MNKEEFKSNFIDLYELCAMAFLDENLTEEKMNLYIILAEESLSEIKKSWIK